MLTQQHKRILDKVQGLGADERELWEERAAIMQYDGGMSRVEAEIEAYQCIFEEKVWASTGTEARQAF